MISENYEDTIGCRLKKIRKSLRLNQSELAEKVEFYASDISDFEKNKREMGIYTFAKLCKALNVSANWLLTGRGEMDYGGRISSENSSENSSEGLSVDDYKELVRLLRKENQELKDNLSRLDQVKKASG